VHFDTVPVPVQVSTSYFHTSYDSGSGSGPLHYFKKNFKIKFLSIIILLKLDGNRLILPLNSLICSPTLIPFKTNVLKPYLTPFIPGAGTGT
jgi:hypothetical protein